MSNHFLLFGSNGQLGKEFQRHLTAQNIPYLEFDRHNTDIANMEKIESSLQLSFQSSGFDPKDVRAILNCAAYTDVEKAEDDRSLCDAVNVQGAENLSKLATRLNVPIVYYSTDFVFDGEKGSPYLESDPVNPISQYGISKLQGEKATMANNSSHYVIRVAWLYGESGNHFIKKVITQARLKPELKIVDDQWGSPTWTRDVVHQTMTLLEKGEFGIYHAVNTGLASRKELAEEIVRLLKLPCRISGCKTADFPMKARRPVRSDLKNDHLEKIGLNLMQNWKEALRQYLESDKSL